MPTMDELFQLSRAPETKRQASARKQEAKNVGRMRTMHGRGPDGATCGDCSHLIGRVYRKCELAHMSRCAATDWRKGWAACGKFEPKVSVADG